MQLFTCESHGLVDKQILGDPHVTAHIAEEASGPDSPRVCKIMKFTDGTM